VDPNSDSIYSGDRPAGNGGFAYKEYEVDGAFCVNESTAMGALRALQSSGKVRKIKMVGFDAGRIVNRSVRSGDIDSLVVQNPYKMGYEGVKAIVNKLQGKNVPSELIRELS